MLPRGPDNAALIDNQIGQGTSVNRLLFALSITVAASMLAGCAGMVPTVAIDEGQKARIKTVAVDPIVKMPPSIEFQGQGQGAAALLAGPFAALVDDRISAEPRARLTASMRKIDLDVSGVVSTGFAKEMSTRSGIAFATSTSVADAQVELSVNRYGLGRAQPVGATLYPFFDVTAVMKTRDGKVVWQATERLIALDSDNKVGHSLEEYLANPEFLRQAMVTGSDLVGDKFAKNFLGLEVDQSVPGIQK
jgi:hypothetical protein